MSSPCASLLLMICLLLLLLCSGRGLGDELQRGAWMVEDAAAGNEPGVGRGGGGHGRRRRAPTWNVNGRGCGRPSDDLRRGPWRMPPSATSSGMRCRRWDHQR
uniref:Uncharacterized protein n=1 Tax=Oryza meridionalis TaxID=40149 RepID=A0A0E0CLH1_9ORYZ